MSIEETWHLKLLQYGLYRCLLFKVCVKLYVQHNNYVVAQLLLADEFELAIVYQIS